MAFAGVCAFCFGLGFAFTCVGLPLMCWELLFFCVFHGLWNMDSGETHEYARLAAIATCCYLSLRALCETLCPTCWAKVRATCWAKVRVFWNWMMIPIDLLGACFFSIGILICYVFPKTFWKTYCVKSVEIETVEGDQRGLVAVADAA